MGVSRLAVTAGHVVRSSSSASASDRGSLTIGYWDIRGLGAPLRMMAEFAGVPYDAKLFDSRTEDWASYKAELIKTNPFANLPFVKDGDRVICQSNACMSYLGAKFGLLGEGEEQRAMVEQCLCQVMDLRNDAVALFYGKTIDHPATDAERYLTGTVATHFAKLEGWLTLLDTPFLVGNSPTAPDFHLFEMLDQHAAFAADYHQKDPIATCPHLTAFVARFRALPQLAGYFAGPLSSLPANNRGARWGGEGSNAVDSAPQFLGLEEIFLKVQDLDAALAFYHDLLEIPLERRTATHAFLQCEGSHVVLQLDGHGGHNGGGPLHYAFTVTEAAFDRICEKLKPDGTPQPTDTHGVGYRTRGPMNNGHVGRTLFAFDPDGNEAEFNTRYLYRPVWCAPTDPAIVDNCFRDFK